MTRRYAFAAAVAAVVFLVLSSRLHAQPVYPASNEVVISPTGTFPEIARTATGYVATTNVSAIALRNELTPLTPQFVSGPYSSVASNGTTALIATANPATAKLQLRLVQPNGESVVREHDLALSALDVVWSGTEYVILGAVYANKLMTYAIASDLSIRQSSVLVPAPLYGTIQSPSIAFVDGHYLAVWSEYGPPCRITCYLPIFVYAAEITSDLRVQGDARQIASGSNPTLGCDESRCVVAWSGSNGAGDAGVIARRFDSHLAPLDGDGVLLAAEVGGGNPTPHVDVERGDVVVSWQSGATAYDPNSEVRATRLDTNVPLTPAYATSRTYTVAHVPVVVNSRATAVATGDDTRTAYVYSAPGPNGAERSVIRLIDDRATRVPRSPENLTATVRGADVDLAWTDRAFDERGFVIEYRKGSAEWATLGEVPKDSTGARVFELDPAFDWSFRVRAFNERRSEPSNIVTTRTAPPAALAHLAGSAVSSTAVVLTWDEPRIASYGVEVLTKAGWNVITTRTSSDRTITIEPLRPNTTYRFRLRGYTADRVTLTSNEIEVRTPNPRPRGIRR